MRTALPEQTNVHAPKLDFFLRLALTYNMSGVVTWMGVHRSSGALRLGLAFGVGARAGAGAEIEFIGENKDFVLATAGLR